MSTFSPMSRRRKSKELGRQVVKKYFEIDEYLMGYLAENRLWTSQCLRQYIFLREQLQNLMELYTTNLSADLDLNMDPFEIKCIKYVYEKQSDKRQSLDRVAERYVFSIHFFSPVG